MALNAVLRGKVALVTGSTTGIGHGILKSLAAAGATTVLHGLVPEAELSAQAQALQQQYGNRVSWSAADLTRPEDIR